MVLHVLDYINKSDGVQINFTATCSTDGVQSPSDDPCGEVLGGNPSRDVKSVCKILYLQD